MIEINFTSDPEEPVFQACVAFVARIYMEKLKLPGFETAKPPHAFVYALDTDRKGDVGNQIVSVEGIDIEQPTFTEKGLTGCTAKLLEALGITDRNSIRLAESCRTATRSGYEGTFSLVAIGATLYVHDILKPNPDYVLSSVDPRFCHGVEKKASLPFVQIEGEWDFDVIPPQYHRWYGSEPQPIAVLHDVRKCYKIITAHVLPSLPPHISIAFHKPT